MRLTLKLEHDYNGRSDVMCKTRMFGAAMVVLFVVCSQAFCIEPVNPNLNPDARKVLNYLESVYQKKTLSGYNVYVHTPDDYEQTGMRTAIWGRDIRWLGDVGKMVTPGTSEHAQTIISGPG